MAFAIFAFQRTGTTMLVHNFDQDIAPIIRKYGGNPDKY